MRIFKETQAFRQWWLLLILSGAFIVIGLALFKNSSGFQNNTWKYLGLIPVLIIAVMFWKLRLHTRIGPDGIKAYFEPFGIFKRSYNWNDISRCYVRKYSPITEYGGWGVRGTKKAKAYNVSGNMGIQIITKNDERFLIGTRKPDEARKVIERYSEKIKHK